MNIFGKILAQLPLLPGIIQGIQYIHGEAVSGATKKQMALDALGLASGAAGEILPGNAIEIKAATELASGAINLIVAGFKATGWGNHGVPIVVPVVALPGNELKQSLRRIG